MNVVTSDIDLWWSYLLSAMGMATAYMAGAGRISAWIVGLLTQLAWVAYALSTAQHGFLLSAAGYGCIYFRHLLAKLRQRRSIPVCTCFLGTK